MRTINRFGGDNGKIQSPNFRKHLRRRRTLDMLNERYLFDHKDNKLSGRLAIAYTPIHSIK